MTHPTQPEPSYPAVPGMPPAGPATPPPPKKKRNTLAIVLLAVAAVLALCVGGTVAVGLTAGNNTPTTSTATTAGARPPAAAPAAEPKVSYATPVPKDFAMAIKVMSKECFGSAGCNVTFNIALTYNGQPAEPGSVWDVTYEVKGGDDPLVDTLELTFDGTGVHGQYTAQREQMIGTPKSTSKLVAAVTAVSEH